MPMMVKLALIALVVLLLKHMLADFFFQTRFQHQNKGKYGHPGGLLHAGIHTILTTPVFVVLPVDLSLAQLVLIGEFLIHYHIDWTKEKVVRSAGWTTTTNQFWQAIGVDQFLHGLTYVVIVAVLVAAQSGTI